MNFLITFELFNHGGEMVARRAEHVEATGEYNAVAALGQQFPEEGGSLNILSVVSNGGDVLMQVKEKAGSFFSGSDKSAKQAGRLLMEIEQLVTAAMIARR